MYKSFYFFILISISIFFGCHTIAQSIQTDNDFRHLIGQTFKVGADPDSLNNYQYTGGSVITPLENRNMVIITEYRLNQNILITFSRMNNTDEEIFTIEDVLHIKDLQPGWEFKSGLCRQDQAEDASILAIVNPEQKEYSNDVKKAWRFTWQTMKLEEIPAKGVDCLNEGFDLSSLRK